MENACLYPNGDAWRATASELGTMQNAKFNSHILMILGCCYSLFPANYSLLNAKCRQEQCG